MKRVDLLLESLAVGDTPFYQVSLQLERILPSLSKSVIEDELLRFLFGMGLFSGGPDQPLHGEPPTLPRLPGS